MSICYAVDKQLVDLFELEKQTSNTDVTKTFWKAQNIKTK